MAEAAVFLRALHIADGTLPIGRFSHSYGVEAWLEAHPEAGPEELRELVETTLAGSVATLDGAAGALAHRAAVRADHDALRRLDADLTARKLSGPARSASTLCGRRLAELAQGLGAGELVSGLAHCNLAVVEGALGAALGIGRGETVLIAIRGHAAAMLSAAVRLGRLGTARSQELLFELTPRLEACAAEADAVSTDGLRSTLPELELHAARHAHRDARQFMS